MESRFSLRRNFVMLSLAFFNVIMYRRPWTSTAQVPEELPLPVRALFIRFLKNPKQRKHIKRDAIRQLAHSRKERMPAWSKMCGQFSLFGNRAMYSCACARNLLSRSFVTCVSSLGAVQCFLCTQQSTCRIYVFLWFCIGLRVILYVDIQWCQFYCVNLI